MYNWTLYNIYVSVSAKTLHVSIFYIVSFKTPIIHLLYTKMLMDYLAINV